MIFEEGKLGNIVDNYKDSVRNIQAFKDKKQSISFVYHNSQLTEKITGIERSV